MQAFEPSPFKRHLFQTGKGYTLGQWNRDVGLLLEQGFGLSRPVVKPERTPEDAQQNRRVEFVILDK